MKEKMTMIEVIISETEDRKIYDEGNLCCIWKRTDFTDNNFKKKHFKR